MKRFCLLLAVLCIVGSHAAIAAPPSKPVTVAVFGDWPYSPTLKANAALLYDSLNNDPDVSLVIHVGDIHSGSQPCTGAGLSPVPTTSIPSYNQDIFNIFQQFKDPFVYTPGDNEWTDCHKTKEGSSGDPLKELAAVRNLFFSTPGVTLGGGGKEVESQADEFEEEHPTDAQFVENVMWKQSQVVFVTLNVPGSNNDGLPWSGGTGAFLNEAARQQEVAARNAANLRWLDRAFKKAKKAAAMVIAIQADMWDPAALVSGGDGLNGYDEFVQALAKHAVAFGRPVLLLNGDSHLFGADQPLADATTATWAIHKQTQVVPNLTRITVQGSTNTPNEWLKLTINPNTANVFTWSNVCYLACQ